MNINQPIIVFSHLRWNGVWQRPQQLLSRISKRFPVIFIEEPVYSEVGQPAYWQFERPMKNILVCTPYTPVADPGFHANQMPELEVLLVELIKNESLRDVLVWLYTPLALPLAKMIKPCAIVYDVMDELSAFKNAPPELLEREAETYHYADIIFTGGPSLYQAKCNRHGNVHCFPSSVDTAHFGKGCDKSLDHSEQAGLPRPRLGFFGVIDERIDLLLLDRIAQERPEWQLIMVGPVIKIDPNDLPQHPNLHYFGQKSYEELPAFLSGWDICLMPFALNESTRFISPTKTLEYMAAEKSIVSTPITDVAQSYGDIVYLGESAEEFIATCEQALTQTDEQYGRRLGKMRSVLLRTSWDTTVRNMLKEITKIYQNQSSAPLAKARAKKEYAPIAIVGGGPTGLSAAYHAPDSVLLEANDTIGGWCRSLEENGFTFDYAGHIMFSNDDYVHEMYRKLLGDNIHWQDREAWIYSKGVHTRYPFQGGLHGLPPEVIKECILGAVEARFGSIETTEAKPEKQIKSISGGNRDKACLEGDIKDCCGDGVLESTVRLVGSNGSAAKKQGQQPYANFEEFIYKVWGAGIAKHFAIPYNHKLWAVDLKEMETSWLGGRVPMPDLEEMLDGALKPAPKPMGPNARFGYPLRGGFQALMNGFLPFLKDRIRLNSRIAEVSPSQHRLTLENGTTLEYGHLISTMPLPVLVRSLHGEVPSSIRKAAQELRYISVRCVNLGIGRPNLTDKHWIYYPEDSVFHRIFVQGNASPNCNPPGGFGLTCEITYAPGKPLPCEGDALIELCIQHCHKVGIFTPDDPIWAANQVDMPHAYVIYDHARAKNVKLIREWLAARDIILAGRYSEWEYYNSDHAFLAGKRAVETVQQTQVNHASLKVSGEPDSKVITSGL